MIYRDVKIPIIHIPSTIISGTIATFAYCQLINVHVCFLSARDKLALLEPPTDLRVVLEKDGTEIDEDDCLEFVNKDDVLMIMLPGQEWTEATPAIVNVYTDHNGSLLTETGMYHN